MDTTPSSSDMLTTTEDRIAWVLAHPGMSRWLKDALRTALDRDPVAVLSDLEMLNTLLRPRSEAQIKGLLTAYERPVPHKN